MKQPVAMLSSPPLPPPCRTATWRTWTTSTARTRAARPSSGRRRTPRSRSTPRTTSCRSRSPSASSSRATPRSCWRPTRRCRRRRRSPAGSTGWATGCSAGWGHAPSSARTGGRSYTTTVNGSVGLYITVKSGFTNLCFFYPYLLLILMLLKWGGLTYFAPSSSHFSPPKCN